MEKKHMYLISFGTSSTYRYYSTADDSKGDKIIAEIKKALSEKFPSWKGLGYIEKANIHRIDPRHEAEYSKYTLLDDKTLPLLVEHLVTEARNEADVRDGILNAPDAEVNPDAL